jgi:hypothetical protein
MGPTNAQITPSFVGSQQYCPSPREENLTPAVTATITVGTFKILSCMNQTKETAYPIGQEQVAPPNDFIGHKYDDKTAVQEEARNKHPLPLMREGHEKKNTDGP